MQLLHFWEKDGVEIQKERDERENKHVERFLNFCCLLSSFVYPHIFILGWRQKNLGGTVTGYKLENQRVRVLFLQTNSEASPASYSTAVEVSLRHKATTHLYLVPD